MKRTTVNTGAIGHVVCDVPSYTPARHWHVKRLPVAYHAGQTAEDAVAFAEPLMASYRKHQRCACSWGKPCAPTGHVGTVVTACRPEDFPPYEPDRPAPPPPAPKAPEPPAPKAPPSNVCPVCQRGFRRSGNGLSWHMSNAHTQGAAA